VAAGLVQKLASVIAYIDAEITLSIAVSRVLPRTYRSLSRVGPLADVRVSSGSSLITDRIEVIERLEILFFTYAWSKLQPYQIT
jgi:hypothetical protein